jgi:membrane complex biogenesis BtpA family protein
MLKMQKPFLIGMIHLPPSPGYPDHPGKQAVIAKALQDLHTLECAGFDAVLVENDTDQPAQIGVSQHVAKAFSQIMEQVLAHAHIPVGMEIIYDMQQTVMVAGKVKADFVRLDVFVDSVSTRWGVVVAEPLAIQKLIRQLGPSGPTLLTDIHVKHATLLDTTKSLEQSSQEALNHGSQGLIVTGDWTGHAPDLMDCQRVFTVARTTPVIIGSGLTVENAADLFQFADAAIVGTSIKTGEYVDLAKATQLAQFVHQLNPLAIHQVIE